MKPIDKVIDHIYKVFQADPSLEKQLITHIDSMVKKMYHDSIGQGGGFCMNLKVPSSELMTWYNKLGLDQQQITDYFIQQWNVPKTAYMVTNPFYHICILVTLYFIKHNNIKIAQNATTLMLGLLWNGRKNKWIQYCDPEAMRTVSTLLTKKHLFRKFDSPMSLIKDYFAPSLIESYGKRMLEDSTLTKRFFDQSWGRIDQIFARDYAPNLETGKNEVRRGIAALYFQVKKAGSKLSNTKIADYGEDGEGGSATELHTTNPYEEIVNDLLHYIIMNTRPKYDEDFLNFVQEDSKVNRAAILVLINNMHNIKLQEEIRTILELIARQLQIVQNSPCKKNFIYDDVKKKVVTSKNTSNISQLNKIIDFLIEQLFKMHVPNIDYLTYSDPSKGKLRKVIKYAIAYNMQKRMCYQGQ